MLYTATIVWHDARQLYRRIQQRFCCIKCCRRASLYTRNNAHAGASDAVAADFLEAPAPSKLLSAAHGLSVHLHSPVGDSCDSNNCEEALPTASVLGSSALVLHRRCQCGTIDRHLQRRMRRAGIDRSSIRSAGSRAVHACSLVDGERWVCASTFAGLLLQHLDSQATAPYLLTSDATSLKLWSRRCQTLVAVNMYRMLYKKRCV